MTEGLTGADPHIIGPGTSRENVPRIWDIETIREAVPHATIRENAPRTRGIETIHNPRGEVEVASALTSHGTKTRGRRRMAQTYDNYYGT